MTTKTAPIQNLEIYPLDELMTHDPVAITVKVTCTRQVGATEQNAATDFILTWNGRLSPWLALRLLAVIQRVLLEFCGETRPISESGQAALDAMRQARPVTIGVSSCAILQPNSSK